MKRVYELYMISGDDQKAMNRALWEYAIEWESEGDFLLAKSRSSQPIEVHVMNEALVPRFCPGPETGIDLRRRYPRAIAFHCYTPKVAAKKKEWLMKQGLWLANQK
jgi:hypothetical protein